MNTGGRSGGSALRDKLRTKPIAKPAHCQYAAFRLLYVESTCQFFAHRVTQDSQSPGIELTHAPDMPSKMPGG
jgi:hypothetical protein